MAEEEDVEEIMAEEIPSSGLALSGIISSVVKTVESYGWFLLLGLIVAYFFWNKALRPRWDAQVRDRSLASSKKYDQGELLERQQAMEAARLRLQEKYAEDARKAQEIAEEKRRQEFEAQVEEWERHKQGRGYHSKPHFEGDRQNSNIQVTVRRTGWTKGSEGEAPKDPRAFVESLIRSKPVVVFSKTWCPYSTKAKQALSTYRLSSNVYEIVELDGRPDGDAIQDVLNQMTGKRSVPRVFVGGHCIGGGDETAAAHRNGYLERLLKDFGAL